MSASLKGTLLKALVNREYWPKIKVFKYYLYNVLKNTDMQTYVFACFSLEMERLETCTVLALLFPVREVDKL